MAPSTRTSGFLTPLHLVSDITQISSHAYTAFTHSDWSFPPAAFGGFLIFLVQKTIALHFRTTLSRLGQPDLINVHVEFLRAVRADRAVELKIKELRTGSRSSVVAVEIHQGESDSAATQRVFAVGTCANRAVQGLIGKETGYALPSSGELGIPIVDFASCLASKDPNWIPPKWELGHHNRALSQVIFALERRPPRFDGPVSSTNRDGVGVTAPIVRHWIRFKDHSTNWTTHSLGICVDYGVPFLPENLFFEGPHSVSAIVRQALGGKIGAWAVPRSHMTFTTTLNIVRPLPETGVQWMFVNKRIRGYRDGWFGVDVELWARARDLEGRSISQEDDDVGRVEDLELVAISQGLWMTVGSERTEFVRQSVDRAGRNKNQKSGKL